MLTNATKMKKKNKPVLETITPEMLKDLQQELKQLNTQWVPELVKLMNAEKKNDRALRNSFRKINDRKIYNVFNDVVKNGAWKMLIYKYGKKLKEGWVSEVNEVIS